MCGDTTDPTTTTLKINGTTTPFNKKELRWLKDQLENCVAYADPNESKTMYNSMLKKVNERLETI